MPGRLNCYIQFPTAWDELLPKEVLEISKNQLIKQTATEAKARVALFILTLRAKVQKQALPNRWQQKLNAEQLSQQLLPHLDFIYKDNDLTIQPEALIKLPGLLPFTVYGPGNDFENLTCGEFEDAGVYCTEFTEDPAAAPLAKMASILWRKKDQPYVWKDKKGLYKTYDFEKVVKRFVKLDESRLFAIFTWYVGCRSQLPKKFPTVYESDEKNNQVDPLAFTRCIHAGAGAKNGSRADIRMMNIMEFMFDMEEEAKKAKELKAMYEEQANKLRI